MCTQIDAQSGAIPVFKRGGSFKRHETKINNIVELATYRWTFILFRYQLRLTIPKNTGRQGLVPTTLQWEHFCRNSLTIPKNTGRQGLVPTTMGNLSSQQLFDGEPKIAKLLLCLPYTCTPAHKLCRKNVPPVHTDDAQSGAIPVTTTTAKQI